MDDAIISTEADAQLLRRFASLSFGFWAGETRRKATLFALGLFACLLLNLAPAIAVNRWNKFFFDALQNKDQRLIVLSIGLMLALALTSALTSVALLQARMRFQLRWREWLTQTLVKRWMERRRFYQLSYSGSSTIRKRASPRTGGSLSSSSSTLRRASQMLYSWRLPSSACCGSSAAR